GAPLAAGSARGAARGGLPRRCGAGQRLRGAGRPGRAPPPLERGGGAARRPGAALGRGPAGGPRRARPARLRGHGPGRGPPAHGAARRAPPRGRAAAGPRSGRVTPRPFIRLAFRRATSLPAVLSAGRRAPNVEVEMLIVRQGKGGKGGKSGKGDKGDAPPGGGGR